MIKTSLICLGIALALRLAFAQSVEVYNRTGSRDDKTWKDTAKQVFIADKDHGRWLTIVRVDTSSPDQKGFQPNWTCVVVKFMPVVRQLANGSYQITFTSPLTKDLP